MTSIPTGLRSSALLRVMWHALATARVASRRDERAAMRVMRSPAYAEIMRRRAGCRHSRYGTVGRTPLPGGETLPEKRAKIEQRLFGNLFGCDRRLVAAERHALHL